MLPLSFPVEKGPPEEFRAGNYSSRVTPRSLPVLLPVGNDREAVCGVPVTAHVRVSPRHPTRRSVILQIKIEEEEVKVERPTCSYCIHLQKNMYTSPKMERIRKNTHVGGGGVALLAVRNISLVGVVGIA